MRFRTAVYPYLDCGVSAVKILDSRATMLRLATILIVLVSLGQPAHSNESCEAVFQTYHQPIDEQSNVSVYDLIKGYWDKESTYRNPQIPVAELDLTEPYQLYAYYEVGVALNKAIRAGSRVEGSVRVLDDRLQYEDVSLERVYDSLVEKFSSSNALPEGIRLYRGTTALTSQLKIPKIGEPFQDNGFVSTTTNLGIATQNFISDRLPKQPPPWRSETPEHYTGILYVIHPGPQTKAIPIASSAGRAYGDRSLNELLLYQPSGGQILNVQHRIGIDHDFMVIDVNLP